MVSVYLAFFLNSSLFNKDVKSDTKDAKKIQLDQSNNCTKINSINFFGHQKQISAKHSEKEHFFNLLPKIIGYSLCYLEPIILFESFFSLFNRPPPFYS